MQIENNHARRNVVRFVRRITGALGFRRREIVQDVHISSPTFCVYFVDGERKWLMKIYTRSEKVLSYDLGLIWGSFCAQRTFATHAAGEMELGDILADIRTYMDDPWFGILQRWSTDAYDYAKMCFRKLKNKKEKESLFLKICKYNAELYGPERRIRGLVEMTGEPSFAQIERNYFAAVELTK